MAKRRYTQIAAFLMGFVLIAGCSSKSTNPLNSNQELTGSDLSALQGNNAGNFPAGSTQDFVQNIGNRVFFTTDSTDLTGESRETLNRQAAWLKTYPNSSMRLEGHADERGTREYNLSLSARRSATVRDYLINQGVDGRRLSKIAYGKERPVEVCEASRCWDRNRRVESVVLGN